MTKPTDPRPPQNPTKPKAPGPWPQAPWVILRAGPSTGEYSGTKFRCHPIPRRLRNRQWHLRQLYLVQLAPKNTQNGVRVRKLRPLTHPALTVLPWYCNKPFTTAEESMNLGCAGASKAQERVQNLAHGHPRGVGCSLTVVVLSLVHAGS